MSTKVPGLQVTFQMGRVVIYPLLYPMTLSQFRFGDSSGWHIHLNDGQERKINPSSVAELRIVTLTPKEVKETEEEDKCDKNNPLNEVQNYEDPLR